jgi:RHS repeat-associated protein
LSFGYTDAGRLNAASGPWGADTYSYDAAGNRTDKARTIAGVTVHETPILASTSNRVTQVQNGSGGTIRTLTWRTGGDLSQDAVTSGATYNYGYNARKRLVSAGAVSGNAGTYGYDYLGRRVWRTVVGSSATVQTHYIFDEQGHLLAEHDGATGAVLREYVWLDDMPVAMIDSTGTSPATYFIHTGQIEEPLVMTDAGQNKVWDAYVEPYGTATVFGSPSAGLDLRLPGQFTQAETGALSQNWNRDYDTSLGRYIEADPLGIDAGQSVYGYVDGDPLSEVDPRGLGPAGGAIGGEIGAWAAGIAGIETGPGEVGVIPAGGTIGSAIGSALEDFILQSQNNRQIRKKICSLQSNIDEHQRKLRQNPDGPDSNHWRTEINAWKVTIQRLQGRLPNGR